MVFAIQGFSSEERRKFPLGLDLRIDRKSMNGWDAKAFNWSSNKLKRNRKSKLTSTEKLRHCFMGGFPIK